MKKMFLTLFAVVVMLTMSLSMTVFAASAKTVNYYDENGNQITINGLYYNSQGQPMFNASCYYLDVDGNPVYVGGCRAYYYDKDGNLVAGNYYYDASGNAVARPSSYPGGWGCGAWYYNAQGNVVNGTTYYDSSGNPVTAPSTTYRGYGRCCGWGW